MTVGWYLIIAERVCPASNPLRVRIKRYDGYNNRKLYFNNVRRKKLFKVRCWLSPQKSLCNIDFLVLLVSSVLVFS